MAFKKKNTFKPLNFSGVITNIKINEKTKGKWSSDVREMSDYYVVEIKIENQDEKIFNYNVPEKNINDFKVSFEIGDNVSFKAFPKKEENHYSIRPRTLAHQMTREQIAEIEKKMEQEKPTDNKTNKPRIR